MEELVQERQQLLHEIDTIEVQNEKERRIAVNHMNAKLKLLDQRIASAKIINLENQPQDEVRFGAKVTFSVGDNNRLQTYQIVGVDEADISKGKISFISPIARSFINKKVGDQAKLKLQTEERIFHIKKISYENT